VTPESAVAAPPVVAVVAARNEADRVGSTLAALAEALPEAEVIVADDASEDATVEVAQAHGASVVTRERSIGKGGNVTAALAEVIDRAREADAPLYLLCDADLGASASELTSLLDAVRVGDCDLAIAAFRHRVGGGFGVALRYATWAIERLCGYRAGAPISGQRALSPAAIRACFPLAPGFGMEIGITVDVVRAGLGVCELELGLEHRATGRSLGGFVHRGRQLRDFTRVYRLKRTG
jgi:glycosyltransferase involved in cell wall biosynthesis